MGEKILKASEVIKILNLDNEPMRKFITSLAEKNYMPEELYIKKNKEFSENQDYFFKTESIIYLKNFLFVYGITGNKKGTFEILTRVKKPECIKKKLKEKYLFLEKKYSIYKNTLFNFENLIKILCDEEKDFKFFEIEGENKLLKVQLIEELEKGIEENNSKFIELIRAQVELGELSQALKNINKLLEKEPKNYEAYSMKGKIYLEYAKGKKRQMNKYALMQESAETSSRWNTFEDLILEEEEEKQNFVRKRFETTVEAYKYLKQGKKYSNYNEIKEAEKIIINHLGKEIFYETCNLGVFNRISDQEEIFNHYIKNGEVLTSKGKFYGEELNSIALEILSEPSKIHFQNEKFLFENIEQLQFYFLLDMDRYIKYSKKFFKALENINLENTEPSLLINLLIGKPEWHKRIFREHLKRNFDLNKKEKFINKLNKLNIEYTENKNQEVLLYTSKADKLKKLYKEGELIEVKNELEESINKMSFHSNEYVKVFYGYMRVIYTISLNEYEKGNTGNAIPILNEMLKYGKKSIEYVKGQNICNKSWVYECSWVEGAKDEYGIDILGEYVGDFIEYIYEKNNMIFKLIEKYEDKLNLVTDDIKKEFLNLKKTLIA